MVSICCSGTVPYVLFILDARRRPCNTLSHETHFVGIADSGSQYNILISISYVAFEKKGNFRLLFNCSYFSHNHHSFSKMFGVQKDIIKVKSYSIDQSKVLGQGAFGIVYKGRDAKKNRIAAKRIDGDKHPRILSQDLDGLMKLDHQNVMKVLDVERHENIVWMMMPFCKLGDMNDLYKVRDVSNEAKIDGMKQIASGISYLHSQDIVHRDIKPGNILVASEIPLQLLLADFDVSKYLDPEVETSLMTSNVGTLAFKAPEFFQRTSPGKIEYHRNVDIYAAGLTFLSILQAEKGKKMLIPHIETPREDSELHALSIGQLIAGRIKYKVPELSIVKLEGEKRRLKWLISQMTYVNPEERLSAAEVLDVLKNVTTNPKVRMQFLMYYIDCFLYIYIYFNFLITFPLCDLFLHI